MAEEITLDTLMQAKGSTALQKQEPVDVEADIELLKSTLKLEGGQ